MVQAGSGFLGSNSLEVEFGLGTQSVIDDIEVHWLCGNISHFENLAPNRFYRLLEEGNTVVYAPVIFESFSVLMNSNSASVTWRSDANIDVSQVVFQRAPLDETLRFENISLDYSLESGVGSAVDTEVQEGESYGYRMMLVDAQGNRAVSPTVTATAGNSYRTPTRAVLGQNFPNPFNPSTTILFTLTARTHVRLTIFDERGRAVRKLYEATLDAGRDYPVNWDGNDDNEAPVASGVYYYALSTDQGTQTLKLALVR
jgi:hypothetical protein